MWATYRVALCRGFNPKLQQPKVATTMGSVRLSHRLHGMDDEQYAEAAAGNTAPRAEEVSPAVAALLLVVRGLKPLPLAWPVRRYV